ncbi:MAG: small multi-drug export protein [Betaproteobacteria bacterium]|nr:MAG: small multi-drug export protein [Betaproteobacteria bacterium]
MLRIGLLLGALMVIVLGIGWLFFPELTLVFIAMTGLNWLIGRAAGMSFGYASNLSHAAVIPANMVIETIQVLLVYPLFVLSVENLLDLPRLKPIFSKLRTAAQARSGAVSNFGIAGLFIFVFMPFWMTGPAVGSIIGFLLGIRPWVNMVVVLSSTYVAICLWGLLLNELNVWASTFGHLAPFALVVAIILLVLGGRVHQRVRARAKGLSQ